MTQELAEKVAAILAQADHGCFTCAIRLAELAKEQWPEFDWEKLVAALVP